MMEKLVPASLVRRSIAVFIDFFVFFGIWILLGIALRGIWWLVFLFVMDVLLTGLWGVSFGRWLSGIRVVRVAGDGPPGLPAALVRTALVFLSGWFGVLVIVFAARLHTRVPDRMWWDAAARTRLVSAKPVALEELLPGAR